MKQDEVEDFCAFADILVPLSQTASRGLRLHRKILEKTQKAAILNVCRFCLDKALDFFKVIENLMRLLHIILITSLEDASLALLIVKESQLDLDVHRVLKLFNSLLHRAKVARKVILRLLLDKGKDYCQLVEEVVHSV